MSAVRSIIAKWGTPASFGRSVGLKRNHPHVMWDRMSIPPLRWPDVVEAAERDDVKGVTLDTLLAAHVADAPLRLELARSRRGRPAPSPDLARAAG